MGLIETKNNNNNTHGGGRGFLLVFFPDHHTTTTSSPSSPATISSPLFRSRSSRLLLSKAQSTISICILFLFLTLFLFTLSTFEPSSPVHHHPHRRFLLNRDVTTTTTTTHSHRFALQGMGTLFLRGTKSMHDLIVSHIVSDTSHEDLRLFLRLLHRSGLTSKSDVVFLFDSPSSTSRFTLLIEEENNSFLKLVHQTPSPKLDSVFGFNRTRFFKKQSATNSEPIWGKKKIHGYKVVTNNKTTELTTDSVVLTELTTELTHGSVLGFDVTELDPENSLSGFMDHVPMSLRRWAGYPMLLGRVRRSFKHVMLLDVKSVLLFGDPLTRVRNRSPESIFLFPSKHTTINPSVLIGGAKGIRKLVSLMHTEIVRATMTTNKKKKNSVTESAVLSQLVASVREGLEVVMSEEMIVEASSLAELRTKNSVATTSLKDHDVIQRGTNSNVNSVIMKRICSSSELDSSVYNYC